VKPDNILLESASGRALVTDFGIAHGGEARGSSTDPGQIMGTAHFMSPEQAAGQPVDGRSDIYALGVVGYLAVSGRLPFESSSLPALMLRQATEVPASVMRAAPGLPPALGAAIDRCLQRTPDERFPDGEALAEALVPPAETRPALPKTLRAWLNARNPLLVPYLGWSSLFTILTAGNITANATGNPGSDMLDVLLLGSAAIAPIFPIIGFHLYQAKRQFRAGHTLADLRAALQTMERERAETDAVARDEGEPRGHRVLRAATVASATWFGTTLVMLASGLIHESQINQMWMVGPLLTTLGLGALSNALDVQFIPDKLRAWWQTGIRDRLWKSGLGSWLARRLGAPERSQLAGSSAFRATEAALGVAAAELFAALPKEFKEQLWELPDIVAALEARATEARAEMDVVAHLVPSGSTDAEVLEVRRAKAASQLSESVAALEGIRLDLLRIHAGAGDLAPLTTLMDAARAIGEDLGRLADAQREVEDAARR
jgi:serine/threonine-protein kinase